VDKALKFFTLNRTPQCSINMLATSSTSRTLRSSKSAGQKVLLPMLRSTIILGLQ